MLRRAPLVFWRQASAWALGIAVVIGIPAVLIPNDFFRRMTPVRWWNFVLWGVTAGLSGALLAARSLRGAAHCKVERQSLLGCTLTFLAVGCPICNKIVVGLIGISGALGYFAPLQPVLGTISICVVAVALHQALQKVANEASNAELQNWQRADLAQGAKA